MISVAFCKGLIIGVKIKKKVKYFKIVNLNPRSYKLMQIVKKVFLSEVLQKRFNDWNATTNTGWKITPLYLLYL